MPDATPFSNEELAKFTGKFKHDSPCECARCRFLATLGAANKRIAELEAELDRQYDVIHGMHGEYQQIWLEKDKRIAELERLVAAWKAYAIAEDTDAEIIARQVLTRFGEPAEFPLGESSKQLAIARAQTLNVGGEEK